MTVYNDPQQEIFSRVKIELEAPFDYLGDVQQTDDANKSAVFGNVYMTIHVWHNNPKQRGTVSKKLLEIKSTCRQIERTPNFAWAVRNIDQRILTDNTTKSPLLHGVLEVEWKFS